MRKNIRCKKEIVSRILVRIIKSNPRFDVRELVTKDVTEASVYADLYSFVAVFYVFCVPHFYHTFRNSLIINEFNILHRKVILALETEISSPATYGIVRVSAIVECKYGVVATLAKQCSAKATNC